MDGVHLKCVSAQNAGSGSAAAIFVFHVLYVWEKTEGKCGGTKWMEYEEGRGW